MRLHLRLIMFLMALLPLAGLLIWGLSGLPAFGHYRGPYGDQINANGVSERHVTNMATAVNFDYRGFDTLGEEFILFAAVTGLALLLRQMRGEIEDDPREAAPGRRLPGPDHAVRACARPLVGFTSLFGLYILAHAQLTPGGGFQGGAILGTACLLVYLTSGYVAFRSVSSKRFLDVAEAAGAGGYVLIGLATLMASGVFLGNVLPLGKVGSLLSGGTIPLINWAVGLEVAAGFILMFVEFLKETRKPRERRGA